MLDGGCRSSHSFKEGVVFSVILRSFCVGIASIVGAAGVAIFVALPIKAYLVSRNSDAGDGFGVGVSWNLADLAHSRPVVFGALLVFVIGFSLGFRHFSRSSPSR